MDSTENMTASKSDRRRAIYERAVEKHRARGTPIDKDPAFVALISEWIDGKVEMADVAKRLSPRGHKPVGEAAAAGLDTEKVVASDQLMLELDRIIGLRDVQDFNIMCVSSS